jgi:hypothetical protein
VVAHGGKGDLPKHVKSNKHSELSEANRKITNSLTSVKGLSVVKSEGLFTKFLIQYNIPLMYHLALIKILAKRYNQLKGSKILNANDQNT